VVVDTKISLKFCSSLVTSNSESTISLPSSIYFASTLSFDTFHKLCMSIYQTA
jgi:hypothetical protein